MKAQQIKKLLWVTSAPITVRAFLRPILSSLRDDFEIHVVSNFQGDSATAEELGVNYVHTVPMARPIAPGQDLRALAILVELMRRERFDIVHSVTPKAGLLGMSAARLSCVPRRIHTFTGQVWATRSGLMRRVLKNADRLIAANATEILADGRAQAAFLVSEGVVRANEIAVLADGSISGVDLQRFKPDPDARAEGRADLGAAEEDVIALFLGRVERDKGVLELADAAAALSSTVPNLHLVIAGPDESGLDNELSRRTAPLGNRFHRFGYVADPERYFNLADIFVLPSYREGFGTSVLEAAACGTPAIISDAYGLKDVVVAEKTGTVVPVNDIPALTQALQRMVKNDGWRNQMAEAAQLRVAELFSLERMLISYHRLYAGD